MRKGEIFSFSPRQGWGGGKEWRLTFRSPSRPAAIVGAHIQIRYARVGAYSISYFIFPSIIFQYNISSKFFLPSIH